MAFVPVKCTSCGATIQLDNEHERGFCSYCGNPMLFKAAEAFYDSSEDEGGEETPFSPPPAAEENASQSPPEAPKASFSELLGAIKKIIENKSIMSHMVAREMEEAGAILRDMRALEPTNPYYLLYDSIIGFYYSNQFSYAFAPSLFHIRHVCEQTPMPDNDEMPNSPVILGGEYMRKKYAFSPMRYASWEKRESGRDGSNADILLAPVRKMDIFATTPLLKKLAVAYADIFMSLLSNHNFYYRYSNFISDNTYKHEYWCHDIRRGKTHSIGRDIHYSGMYDNSRGTTIYEDIIYSPAHRASEQYCVADNVLEYFIPYLRAHMKAPAKEILIQALADECLKYPNSTDQ